MAINQELIDTFNQAIGQDYPTGGESEFLEQCRRIGYFVELHDKFKTEETPEDWQEAVRLKSALVNLEIAVDRAYRIFKKDGPFFEDDDEEDDDDEEESMVEENDDISKRLDLIATVDEELAEICSEESRERYKRRINDPHNYDYLVKRFQEGGNYGYEGDNDPR